MRKIVFLLVFIFVSCEMISVQVLPSDFSGYDIPDYFHSQLTQKEQLIKNELKKRTSSSFIFFTDAHWEINSRYSPEIVRHILNNSGISKVFFGGDAFTGEEDKNEALAIAKNFIDDFCFTNDFFPVFGNHDSNRSAGKNNPDVLFDDTEVESLFFSSIQYNKNVHYCGRYFYYIDDEATCTRWLCLDTGKNDFSSEEKRFVLETLINTTEGWHVIVVTHIIFDALDYFDPNTIYLSSVIKQYLNIFDSYNRRKGYFDNSCEYIFSEAKGKVEFIIGGHIHRDYIDYSESGIPLIALDCDCRYTYSQIGHQKGTINEQCVTVVVADYASNKLIMNRVGRGEDIEITL